MSPVLGVLLSVALAFGTAPVSVSRRFEDIEVEVSRLAAEKRYPAMAAMAERAFERRDLEAYQRRVMAFHAIRGHHGAFEETGEVANLCRARRLLRRVERDVGLDDDAGTAARLRSANAKYLAAGGGEKQCVKRARTVESAPAVASRPPTAEPDPAPTDERADPTTAPAATASIAPETPMATPAAAVDELAPVGTRTAKPVSRDMSQATGEKPEAATAPSPLAGPPAKDGRHGSVALTRGGITLLSLGAVAGGVFGASLYYRGYASDTIDALAAVGEQRGGSTPEALARAQRLNQSYQNLTAVAGVSGALAIAGVVSGVVLLALKPRRTTMAAAPWATPTGAGLSFRGNF